MNTNAIAKHYDCLTPEERFRLILAASGRGDDEERDRLGRTGRTITLSVQDHAPHAHAFDEVATMIFLDLLDEAAGYLDVLAAVREEETVNDADDQDANGDTYSEVDEAEEADEWLSDPWDLPLACGFLLRTKVEGWKLFCERLNIPPVLLWEPLPGYQRLQRALALAEKIAFYPEGFRRWMNERRPEGAPELKLTDLPFTVERIADANQELFRERLAWWGG
ncbi:MAG TPA: hypothetical protein VH575_28695 [Gemmataceae bacterium]|jgi:hypothetical protein